VSCGGGRNGSSHAKEKNRDSVRLGKRDESERRDSLEYARVGMNEGNRQCEMGLASDRRDVLVGERVYDLEHLATEAALALTFTGVAGSAEPHNEDN